MESNQANDPPTSNSALYPSPVPYLLPIPLDLPTLLDLPTITGIPYDNIFNDNIIKIY